MHHNVIVKKKVYVKSYSNTHLWMVTQTTWTQKKIKILKKLKKSVVDCWMKSKCEKRTNAYSLFSKVGGCNSFVGLVSLGGGH